MTELKSNNTIELDTSAQLRLQVSLDLTQVKSDNVCLYAIVRENKNKTFQLMTKVGGSISIDPKRPFATGSSQYCAGGKIVDFDYFCVPFDHFKETITIAIVAYPEGKRGSLLDKGNVPAQARVAAQIVVVPVKDKIEADGGPSFDTYEHKFEAFKW